MSEEYTPERTYSAFWPMLIFLVAFIISSFYQLYEVLEHRSAVNKQYDMESVNLPKAQAAQTQLVSLMNDLLATAAKDANAAQIVREAKQAGIIRDRAPGSTNAAPANP